jgi:8-oxo-dGTP pyrophosphatase MutT (NUDIX family)
MGRTGPDPMPRTRFYYRDPGAPRPAFYTLGVTALIEREGKLLLERRRDTGQWNPPGGKIELDESLDQALRKEVLEETGLTIAGYSLFGTFSDPSRIGQFANGAVIRFVVLAYVVRVDDFSTLCCSDESLELGWFGREELADQDIAATGRDVLEAYLTRQAPVLD